VARFSLLTALAFLLITPLPLVIHLGRPERALEMFLTPNFRSAMSAFGYIWFFYLLIVLGEIWLVFRPDIVRYAQSTEGVMKTVYSILALGIYDISEESLAIDKKIIKVLAFIGVPTAFLLHGYVGFIFGAVKANPWWSTPLMPIIFLMSATVSGIALLIVLYIVVTRVRRVPLDYNCLNSLALWLSGFLAVNFVLEALEVFSMLYESEESWGIISQLITQKIAFSYFGIQFVLGAILPLFILGSIALVKMSAPAKAFSISFAAASVLIGVFAMRWNVVVGGQLISKSLRGLASYTPPILGLDGVLVSVLLLASPFVILAVFAYVLPPWQDESKAPASKRFGFSRLSRV
ncbi:MAG: polysulfide reductase NrfD, partial [Chloroflexi bacterium]|nr:polysulfide reductase NrfD [Chloroflexota bacterium]